jgi:hypothetical protein
VLEAMVYDLVKESTKITGYILGTVIEHKERHKISSKVFATSGDLLICEKVKKYIHIDDAGVDFGKLIIFLKNKRIITDTEFKKIDW